MQHSVSPEQFSLAPESFLVNDMWDAYLRLCDETPTHTEAEFRQLYRSLPPALQFVVAFTTFDGDILNGGIAQYFYNHTPREVAETLTILQTIGAVESSAVLKQAIDYYATNLQWNASSEERFLNCPPHDAPELRALDDQRCNDKSSERDYLLLEQYLREHWHRLW